jgi:metal-responsive CopG/Arc/MetJ family transcriptional regulator
MGGMKKKTPVALKFDTDLLEEIDAFLASLPFPTPRTAFIEIACREKLERESRKGRK